MGLFQEAKSETAFLKMGIYGSAGSGKTYTATSIAIGLHEFIKSKKPVYFLDSETGADFVINRFKKAGIKLFSAKTRAFKDLLEAVNTAEKERSILILDSITHFWNELMDAYQKKHNKTRIYLRDWIPLKQTWREFTERYINSNAHIIMCGRVGDIWEDIPDDEGVLETKKTGTKMKAEIETAFEPSLLVEMAKHRESPRPGAGWVHRAWIEKDRFDVIDGKYFDDPGFKEFLPHIELLNLGGKHKAIDMDRNSQDLFETGNNGEERYKRHQILLEKIEAEIHLLVPGSANNSDVKTARLELMNDVFGTRSKKEIEGLDNSILETCLSALENKSNIKKAQANKENKTKEKK